MDDMLDDTMQYDAKVAKKNHFEMNRRPKNNSCTKRIVYFIHMLLARDIAQLVSE